MSKTNLFPDIRFEADVLRAALLLGLVHESDVPGWADALLATQPDPGALLADVAVARPELTAMREALLPLATPTDDRSVGLAILAFLARDPHAVDLPVADCIRVLSQLRREIALPADVSAGCKHLEDRWMLGTAGIHPEQTPTRDDIAQWLETVRSPAYYRVSLERDDEPAAFLGALSRAVFRERRWQPAAGSAAGQAWVVRDAGRTCLVLNESLSRTAMREFAPLPLGSRLPYATVPDGATLVLDENSAAPLGVIDASDRLTAI
jgi:hypothetical protein